MLKRYFGFFISSLIILFSIFIAIITRNSFIDNTLYASDLFLDYTVQLDEKPLPFYDNSTNTLDSLFNESELVVKVKTTTNQLLQNKCILSEVLITAIYKGNDSLVNTNINIYEYGFMEMNSQSYIAPSGYIPMKPNNEYILFLKHPTPSSVYKENFYIPLNPKYSKYTTNPSDFIKYTDNLNFKNIHEFNIILNNEKDIKAYTEIKNDLLLKIQSK
ncbi:MAG: hypothetical protein ACRC30_06640 [Clostridium sp.]